MQELIMDSFHFPVQTQRDWEVEMSPPLTELWPQNASQLSLATDLNRNETPA